MPGRIAKAFRRRVTGGCGKGKEEKRREEKRREEGLTTEAQRTQRLTEGGSGEGDNGCCEATPERLATPARLATPLFPSPPG